MQDLWKKDYFLHLGWDKLGECVDLINAQIEQSEFKPTTIIGISRGGLGLASFLANYQQLQDFYVICVKRNKSDKKFDRGEEARFEWLAPQPKPGAFSDSRILVVDDITGDGGTLFLTLKVLKEMGASQIKTAVIAKNVHSKFEVDFQAITVDEWIIFPWERHDDSKKIKEIKSLAHL
jgi:hypothetical protein